MDTLRFLLYYFTVDTINIPKESCNIPIIPTDTTIIFTVLFWLLNTKNTNIINWIVSSFLAGSTIRIKNIYCDNSPNEIYCISFGIVYGLIFDWIEIELFN
jgi:hypothetical protein